jgi:hypothetical protein
MTALQLLTAVRKRGASFEAVVVGDAALTLLGVISRPLTRCRVLAPWVPLVLSKQGRGLEDCVALRPSTAALRQVEPWLLEHDLRQAEVWKARVAQALREVEDAVLHPPQRPERSPKGR